MRKRGSSGRREMVEGKYINYYYYRERRGVAGQERVEEERLGPNQEQSVSNGWSGKGE